MLTGPLRAAVIAPGWLVSRRFEVLVGVLDELGASTPSIPGLEWQALTASDAPEIAAINPLVDADAFQRRFALGMACFGVRLDGALVHYRWYASTPVWLPFLRLRWVPEPGDYTVFDVFTAPEARRRGLHTTISIQALERARGLGLRRFVAFIAWWNEPSLLVARRLGAVRAGSVTLWRLGPLSAHSSSGAIRIEGDALTIVSR